MMEQLQRRALTHATDLLEHAGAAQDEAGLLFAHTLDPSALLGVALWYDALPERERPALALNVMLGAGGEKEYRESLARRRGFWAAGTEWRFSEAPRPWRGCCWT